MNSNGDVKAGVLPAIPRILDIDLDFFVQPVVTNPEPGSRPCVEGHTVWAEDRAIDFLRENCGLVGRTPGILTEKHDALFYRWRGVIDSGVLAAPFHVTHLDAHADLGSGDLGYKYLMTSLLLRDHRERSHPDPPPGKVGVTEGNFLLFAIACRWISDLSYIYGDGGGSDELRFVMQGFNLESDSIQLACMSPKELSAMVSSPRGRPPSIEHLEPAVPYNSQNWRNFQADQPYDFVCLTRSPQYSPATADPLFEVIADLFIEPI
ncbi:hypothetical protein CH254_04530 [Rhodococcus sp. 06-412-2C]|uniref:UPF0489 family protein n=1 Tax=unclassified Rhodococcus (in: high G+C Gram-positive bacteria) TaxID=192944 RepID=UPI000B9A78E1|nr:hypothetical protein CH254_04530 [Rhodococcus sp. 06-412-2C]OZC92318.1 hypothetical protein CH279_25805 [Rhodococcus sp. 06-412-2B]